MHILRDLQHRVRVWKNRRRHYDIIDERLDEHPVVVAQRMMIRDRIVAREGGIQPCDTLYPCLSDYLYSRRLGRGRMKWLYQIFDFFVDFWNLAWRGRI